MLRRVVVWSMAASVWWCGCIQQPADSPDAFTRDEGASSPWLAMMDDAPPDDAGIDAAVGIPCAIDVVLQGKCHPCHDGSLLAPPWTLSNVRDFYAVSALDAPRTLADVAVERVSAEGARRMPPPMAGPLDEAERTMLLTWLRDGAPAGAACPASETGESTELPEALGLDAGATP